jgi:hypothetical protein
MVQARRGGNRSGKSFHFGQISLLYLSHFCCRALLAICQQWLHNCSHQTLVNTGETAAGAARRGRVLF